MGFDYEDLGSLGQVDTAFVVGTGALEERGAAWQPVLDAIHDVVLDLGIHCKSPEHANFFMAELIAVNRSVQAVERSRKRTESLVPERLRRVREQIASRLKAAVADRRFSVRRMLLEQIAGPGWGARRKVLTTNWDTSLDASCRPYLNGDEVLHVHGSVEQPGSLYLPSDYACDEAHPETVRQHMLELQHCAIEALRNARNICIYGLSLDPLDAELAAILQTAFARDMFRPPLDRIVIFNRQDKQQELEWRVGLLLQLSRFAFDVTDPPQIEFRAVD